MTNLWTTSSAVFSLNSDGNIIMKRSGIILLQSQIGVKISLPDDISIDNLDINIVSPSKISLFHNGDEVEFASAYHQACIHHHSLNLIALISVDVGDILSLNYLNYQHKIAIVIIMYYVLLFNIINMYFTKIISFNYIFV